MGYKVDNLGTSMPQPRRQSPDIRHFILMNVTAFPDTIGTLTAAKFGVSRTTVSNYISRLIDEGLLTARGNTRARRYERKIIASETITVKLTKDTAEDMIWRFKVLPLLHANNKNVVDICQYGFTEILNNCVDHSVSDTAMIAVNIYYDEIEIRIYDSGVGIFEKIRSHFGLVDHRHALLELTKGKITSDSERHSGEGIFFTSRMFNKFFINSGHLFYSREMKFDDDWLIETDDIATPTRGSAVGMTIATSATWSPRDVFEKYQESGNISFRKTHVPIKLGRYPGEQLVSRSQAKRIISRFGSFSEVILDFAGIDQIGQAFADEIFRVFPTEHPEISLLSVRTCDDVAKMIAYVRSASRQESDGNTFFSLGLMRSDSD